MRFGWSQSPIGSIADPVERLETPIPGRPYRQIGVRLWGEGAYERETIDGGETKYTMLNRVEYGDIIVNKIWARNGSVSVVTDGLAGGYCSGEFPLFKPTPDRLDPKWFYWITKTRWFWHRCDVQSRGTSGKNRIQPEKFLSIEIPLPPLSEQRRIVEKIERLATRIAEANALRHQQQELERLVVSLAHRFDLSDKVKMTSGWLLVKLADVLELSIDPITVDPDLSYPNLGIFTFGRGLFSKEPIDGATTSAKTLFRVKTGQLIYSRLFAFEGAYARVTDNFNDYFVSNEFPAFNCDRNFVTSDFLWAYFRSPRIWSDIAAGSKGLGDRRQRVHPEQILQHQCLIPPIEYQSKITRIQNTLELLAVTRKSSFSGSRYFCESLFWASQPKQAAKT